MKEGILSADGEVVGWMSNRCFVGPHKKDGYKKLKPIVQSGV
jgi:hypothetical protein